MKKYINGIIGILFGIAALTGCGSNENDTTEVPEVQEEDALGEYVALGPDVKLSMLEEAFWGTAQDREKDRELLSLAQISQINRDNPNLITTDTGNEFVLTELEEEISALVVKELLTADTRPKQPEKRFVDGEPTTEEYWDALITNNNEELSSDKLLVRFGFCVNHSVLKKFPTDDFIGKTAEDLLYDENARAECPAYAPVAVLHESLDGEWYYVACCNYAGWIRKENIALCESKESWLDRQNPEEFLVVTGRELRLLSEPYQEATSELLLAMGTVLPLVPIEEAPEEFYGRMSYGSYIVCVPVRTEEGMIDDAFVLVPVSEDVSVGYLPYTQENLKEQLFKWQGDRYGWAGMYQANDCSGFVREVFACFGFDFPRSAKVQITLSGMKHIDVAGMTEEEKLALLETLPLGSLLYFEGHIMVYLGMSEEIPYVISAVGSWATPDMQEGESLSVNSVVINSLTGTTRKDGSSWLKHITEVLVCAEAD